MIADVEIRRFEALKVDARAIKYLILKDGGMATKTAIEDVLMQRHNLLRVLAHEVTNALEGEADRSSQFRQADGWTWLGEVSEPRPEDWPEVYPAKLVGTSRSPDGTKAIEQVINDLVRRGYLEEDRIAFQGRKLVGDTEADIVVSLAPEGENWRVYVVGTIEGRAVWSDWEVSRGL